MAKHLHKGDETLRRGKIIGASRAGDAGKLPQLLASLDGDETYENKRHIVRALGKIGLDQRSRVQVWYNKKARQG
ncbi:MAG: hypothetical protein ACM3ZC_04865 [Bacteroidota bacterium]